MGDGFTHGGEQPKHCLYYDATIDVRTVVLSALHPRLTPAAMQQLHHMNIVTYTIQNSMLHGMHHEDKERTTSIELDASM